ncbi:MAG: FAD-dependent oxidoreductase [Anaerolineae bacterium]|nr:FAD-dependent oxidoreductase [Anaerolineae bacterium]
MGFDHKTAAIQQLEKQIKGRVLTPDDTDYQQIGQAHNLSIVHHPALILIPENSQDVVAGMRFARAEELTVGVQTTGHGIYFPIEGGLLILSSEMHKVTANIEAKTVQVEAGAIWQNVLDVITPHGLAPLLGSSPHVGVVGYTLGGGVGYLGRKYGFAADSVRWIELVTAEGELIRASATEHSDLFWGLRGGGGNFGVITAMEFCVYPVATLYGGNMQYPGEVATEAMRFYRDWIKTLPDEMTTSLAILKFPVVDLLPPAMRGTTQVLVRAAYIGDPQKGAELVQPWLDWRKPASNTMRVMPFTEVATISNDPTAPTATYGTNMHFDELSDEAIDIIVRRATDPKTVIIANELRHVGGTISRVPADSNAIANRDTQIFFGIGTPVLDSKTLPQIQSHMHQTRAELQPYLHQGAYFNLMAGPEAAEQSKNGYGNAHHERLLALKKKYDPENIFRYGIPLVTEDIKV